MLHFQMATAAADDAKQPNLGEPYAAWLLRTGQLWPTTLTNPELLQEWRACRNDVAPISSRMLREELDRRKL